MRREERCIRCSETIFLIIIQGNKQDFHPAKAPSKLQILFLGAIKQSKLPEPSLQQGPSGVKAS